MKEHLAFWIWLIVILALITTAWLIPHDGLKTLLDNCQWTLAFAGSAWLAWSGIQQATAAERTIRLVLAAGAGLILAGQLVWNLQVASGWNPFPTPADALFLMAATMWIAGWLFAIVRNIPHERLLPSLLDIGGVMSALIAAILIVYVPSSSDTGITGLIVLVLYPALFLLAAGLAGLVLPALQLIPSRSHLLVVAGMAGYGLSWMHWNLLVLQGALVPGSLYNASYSVSALLLGLGARNLAIKPMADKREWCERTMRYLPLFASLLALLTLVLLFRMLNEDDGIVQHTILACCLLALILATVRQTLLVNVVERLRRAETAILQNETQVYRLANYDSLTELPNRHLFEDRLEHGLLEARARQERMAVLLIDLDLFQQINNSFGHRVGDRLIREVAQRLQSCSGPNTSIARMGGDEFMLMIKSIKGRTEIARMAESLLCAIRRPQPKSDFMEHFLTASIGISVFPDDAQSTVELVRNADSALTEAKSSGRGCYRFYLQAYTEATRRSLELRTHLHAALAKNEFSIVYQPQYDHHRKLVGMEALLRWRTKDEMISPDEFIPIAEESGLIVPIGQWVFEAVCDQIVAWRSDCLDIPSVSVNLSARQLREPGIAKHLAQVTKARTIAPESLVLEVTESQLLDDDLVPVTAALRNQGFVLSIDDFGTGQSSLVKLKKLPVSEVKIDKAFVRDIAKSAEDREICATIHALALTLGMDTVAEGVETEAQFEQLVAMGCRRFQGWLFAPAMTAQDIALLAAHVPPDNALKSR